ncbi:conjugative transfer system coupling protein TraD [Polaromonas naphthalenivorans]|uniref:TraD/TraG TraM recognition site domain-containing protein n=1 Tax=Polaromonas naphthalenivorans (strain CJ2) TaxID=365044 RepID=A1VVD4_POLNA|nr:conjugative transfer system coupling protein TraD [Polaromonas naphthalenivorans]ABM39612.1 conserved hypothetical protein [Polaromonas naphthalenivorans CJ2]
MRKYEDMFRPAHEGYAVAGWAAGALLLVLFRPPFWWAAFPVILVMLMFRGGQLETLWKFRLSLAVMLAPTIPILTLLAKSRQMRKQKKSLYLGRGFQWGQRHAEIAQQVMNRNITEIPDLPDFLKKHIEKILETPPHDRTAIQKAASVFVNRLMPKHTKVMNEAALGLPWIHGIGAVEDEDISLPLSVLTGHTLILGTTRAGKTRLFELLTTQVIDMGSALIVIDPKKDRDWVNRLRMECKRKGRKFLYFDAAKPSESIRINPLANWNNISEPATRIGQLVDADGSFAAFAWKTLVRVQRGLVAAGERPSIKNTKHYVQMGVDSLAERVLTVHFMKKYGPEWDRDIKNSGVKDGPAGQKGPPSRLDLMIAKFIKDNEPDDAIAGLISMITHSKEHFSKMIQVLEPILEMLGSDEIGDLLSPDPTNLEDKRPIYDMRKVIDEKAVLYVGLDSLSNKTIAQAIGSILLADIASTLGSIYNFSSNPADCYLFVDETAEVANDQLTQILNKGGGAGMKVFLAMQSIADLSVCFQSKKDKAEQMLGNLNNLISLRVQSVETAQYVSDKFSEVGTRAMDVAFSSGSGSSEAFTEFRSNVSRSLKTTNTALVSPALLTKLPPLHYFAFIAGRSYIKGCLPFIGE